MSLTSSGNVSLPVTPTISGTLVSASHNLTANTNVPTGYNLTLSTTGTPSLTPTAGTLASPTTLTNNTWGYALLKVDTSTSSNTIINSFDVSYATPTPSATSKWANPSEDVTIKNTTYLATQNPTIIYYGAKVDTTQPSGTYTNTVRYTATANISTIPAPTITSITPNSGTTDGGTQVTIVGTGFTVNDESVTTTVTMDGLTCTDVEISSNTPATGQDTIYCNTPIHISGAVDVAVTTWSGTTTKTNGYTYIAPASVSFVSPSTASTIAGTESGPAFTIVGTNFSGTGSAAVTNVTIGGTACQSFEIISSTHIFCKAPNTINTTGNKKIEVIKTNVTSMGNTNITYNSTNYPTFQSSLTSAFANCTTTATLFRDGRDSQLYYVKKMPDNKCWMVDNLKYANYGNLSQEANKYLTVDGTDTQSTTNSDTAKYVDPGATDYCKGNTSIPTNTNTRCGLLYNWYTATRGTGTYAEGTIGNQVTGSICPANFRLPSAMSNGSTPISNGTSYGAADLAVLNASMNAGASAAGSTTAYPTNWQPSGSWGGAFSGYWRNNFDAQNTNGYFWSSTANYNYNAYGSYFTSSNVYPGNTTSGKYSAFAVRCVMDDPIKNFSYTGAAQTFTALKGGNYKIELWGAAGGDAVTGGAYGNIGKAGYASGNISLTQGETLYIYVGGQGTLGTYGPSTTVGGKGAIGGWNGGGNGGDPVQTYGGTHALSKYAGGASGGGATDIRLTSGAWNNTASLRSRIMVAGAGGAAGTVNIVGKTGNNMGLTGAQGGSLANYQINNSPVYNYPNNGGYGGTQTTGGAVGSEVGAMYPSFKPIVATAGTFGIGGRGDYAGNMEVCFGHGGGGGGYYGGGGAINSDFNCFSFGGGGGSSFISGHTGSNAINASGAHTGQPNHYSGKVFTNTLMIGGNASMPNPSGGTESGHSGNGYARITFLGY